MPYRTINTLSINNQARELIISLENNPLLNNFNSNNNDAHHPNGGVRFPRSNEHRIDKLIYSQYL